MHTDDRPSIAAAGLAPRDERDSLELTALPASSRPAFHLTHPYFEIVYAPILGPSAVLLGRYLGRLLAGTENEALVVCPAALSQALGMRSNSNDPLGSRSLLKRSIARLEHNHIVRWLEPQHLGVITSLPAASDRLRERLPPGARHAHDHFVQAIDLREKAPERFRACNTGVDDRSISGP